MAGADDLPPEVREYLRAKGEWLGREHGARGGDARAQKLSATQRKRIAKRASDAAHAALTPEERSERARKAAAARWAAAQKKEKPDG